ncbi:Inner membrane protein YpjD [Pigmentiphaga humi]|uniref:Inner membrane protein YpjD n=1 Tax=Pigmentiphaga humi TaxID=2478468 RepID=A0A3P4B2W3_9BURK|nr:cytochrome c biogenesis protein CcsA [Pigmentiphaga humi]VCU69495.1 Inner membrane protein YpjD [Pigmentiphaga humi]
MDMGIVLHALAAAGYALLTALAWRGVSSHPETRMSAVERTGLTLVLVLHGLAVHQAMLGDGDLRLGFALGISAALWLGLIVFWAESLWVAIDGLRLWLMPLGAVATALQAVFPEGRVIAHADSGWLRVHLAIALAAYSMITIAALHALLMASADRRLHDLSSSAQPSARPPARVYARLLDAVPPVLVLERLLFRLIWIGFVLLTLAVLTGIVISEALSGTPLPFDHKTVFTLLSWLTFGLLLLGRQVRGWRGRTALRWTLAGFAFLLLAYTGTRFVLEFILHR